MLYDNTRLLFLLGSLPFVFSFHLISFFIQDAQTLRNPASSRCSSLNFPAANASPADVASADIYWIKINRTCQVISIGGLGRKHGTIMQSYCWISNMVSDSPWTETEFLCFRTCFFSVLKSLGITFCPRSFWVQTYPPCGRFDPHSSACRPQCITEARGPGLDAFRLLHPGNSDKT